MTGRRDIQRGRVYAWENRIIAPHDSTFVAYGRAQAMVDSIWADMGLQFPPGVEPLPSQSSATLASATRLSIFLPAQIPSWCLLHELAHAMTSDVDGSSEGHGPIFMGVYLKLIARYFRLDPDRLLESAAVDGIVVTSDASPIFIDAVCRNRNVPGQTRSGRIERVSEKR